jgi:uncharacterized protein
MKILIDIGHPAHVHYFRNFIRIMEIKGHEFLIIARDKEVTHKLLKAYNIPYINRGKGKNSLIGKFIYIPNADSIILKHARRFKPNLFLSFASPYASHIAWLMKKPHVTFDDTEHAKLGHLLYEPFSNIILSPNCFIAPFSKKQIFFESYMELCYLHKDYYKPDARIKTELGLKENEKYVIIRFVSWNANHDIGQKGLSYSTKVRLINEVKKHARVFISSESALPPDFEPYRLQINPEKLHDILAHASLYIGEGSTTASECSILGTPNIYINSLVVGYCKEQEEKYNVCFHLKSEAGIIEKSLEILCDDSFRDKLKSNHSRMLKEKINPTAFMVWFIENFPQSAQIMKDDPDYQYNFR